MYSIFNISKSVPYPLYREILNRFLDKEVFIVEDPSGVFTINDFEYPNSRKVLLTIDKLQKLLSLNTYLRS